MGNSACALSFSSLEGASGGLLYIWCGTKGKAVFSFSRLGYLRVCLEWHVNARPCFVLNVYVKCPFEEKLVMWHFFI